MERIIEFAKESDINEIMNLIHKCFEKENGFFQKLVPILYGKDKNPSKNHLIIKDNDKIIATIAIRENIISIEENEYKFLLLGSLGVDHNYRNQGIMGLFFEYILNNYSDSVDFFVLTGKFDRYKRFGFFPSAKIEKVIYPKSELELFNFDILKDSSKELENLYNKKTYKVNRECFFDSLNTWTFVPYIIKREDKILGYLVYNFNVNLIEEIVLDDYSLINEICKEFGSIINKDVGLKLSISNKELHSFIDNSLLKEEHLESNLYKIVNQDLKEIYIPKSDLI